MGTRARADHRVLVDELAGHLAPPVENVDEPFIVETRVDETRSLHALVIWDRWKALTRAERSKVIVSAYSKSGRAGGRAVTAAMGLTQREALQLGFLPYSISILHRANDRVRLQELERVYGTAGGVVEKVGGTTVRRFPTQQAAENAYRKLSSAIPGPYWALVHELGTTGAA
jgi:hypothetical protein